MQANYLHVCRKVKCNACGCEAYDTDFKSIWETKGEGDGVRVTERSYECPKCQSRDTIFVTSKSTSSTQTTTYTT